MINKNTVIAVILAVLGMGYLIFAGVLGYNLIPPITDVNGNQVRAWGAVFGIIAAVITAIGAGLLNNYLNEREADRKQALAEQARREADRARDLNNRSRYQ